MARASTRSGSPRSTPRPTPTSATTSPTTRRSRPSTGRSPTSTRCSRTPTRAASGCSWTSSSPTRRSSTRGSASTPTATSGPTGRSPRTTGSPPSAGRPGPATSAPAGSTCTASTPSSPTSTGATPTCARRWRTSSASGPSAGSTASASTRSTGSSRTCELRDDPRGAEPFPLPVHPDQQDLDLVHSRDAPDIGVALAALREAAGELPLIGEVYLPTERARRYLEHFDAAFAFDLLHARPRRRRSRAAIARTLALGRPAWVTSNHDFSRVATRWGPRNARAAAVLLLTLGGPPSSTRARRSEPRTAPAPIRRSTGSAATPSATRCAGTARPAGGFTEGTPWLPASPTGPRRSRAAGRSRLDADPVPAPDRAARRDRRRAGPGRVEPGDARLRARAPPRRRQPRRRAGRPAAERDAPDRDPRRRDLGRADRRALGGRARAWLSPESGGSFTHRRVGVV